MSTFWIVFALKATLWASVISIAAWIIPPQHPRARRALAVLGLWGVWIVPWLRLPVAGLAATELAIPQMSASPASSVWLVTLSAIWLVGSLILLARLLGEAVSIQRLVRNAEADQRRLAADVDVRLSREIEGPCMTGWWRPCVLLPAESMSWPEPTLHAALRHEGQHVRQRDGLHRLCTALLQAVFWWNPAVHLLCRVYEHESEVCCDIEAASTGVNRHQYGEMLLAHATGLPPRSLTMPFARRTGLRGRISRLLVTRDPSRWQAIVRWSAALELVVAAGVLVAAVHIAPPSVQELSALQAEAKLRLGADPFPGTP